MEQRICIHAHCYQPPRENPWLEEVELQDSAYPYHDWNSRVTAECYAPNTASRILGPDRKIIDIFNNFSRVSFNFGPTLLSWMQKKDPQTYQAILDADEEGRKRFSGHGCALAQAYNHMIMPLANSRDKRTQVSWGIADFQARFKRKPEGMWLPETAVDLETLDIMAEQGILFTILSPGQARRIRKAGDKTWQDVPGGAIDPKIPYACLLPSGRTIALFFYDGPISHDLAFGKLLTSGEGFFERLSSAFDPRRAENQLVHVATDGETYGHHHRFAEMALTYCLYMIESGGAGLTVYGEYLANNPAAYEVQIHENSSWSCFHGIERWRSNCGCHSGGRPGWQQEWRVWLREAFDWLRDRLAAVYQDTARPLLKDPWLAREEYISVVLDRSSSSVEVFLAAHAARQLTPPERTTVLKLLEMQRHLMLMYTSCGWFFDEISGIETVQVIQYAARALQLARETSGVDLEADFVRLLEKAPSNIPEFRNGAWMYENLIKPGVLDLLRVGVHYAVFSLFRSQSEVSQIYSYLVESQDYESAEQGRQSMALGRVRVTSTVTGEQETISFAVMYFGDQNLIGAARAYTDESGYARMKEDLREGFRQGHITDVVRLVERHFNQGGYSLWHLFKDEQRIVVRQILDAAVGEITTEFRQILEHHMSIVQVVDKLKIPLPRAFASVAEFVLNTDIREALEGPDPDPEAISRAVHDLKRFSLAIDRSTLNYVGTRAVNRLMQEVVAQPRDRALIEQASGLMKVLAGLSLDLNLWKAQNLYFSLGKALIGPMREQALHDPDARRWLTDFGTLGHYLGVSTE